MVLCEHGGNVTKFKKEDIQVEVDGYTYSIDAFGYVDSTWEKNITLVIQDVTVFVHDDDINDWEPYNGSTKFLNPVLQMALDKLFQGEYDRILV